MNKHKNGAAVKTPKDLDPELRIAVTRLKNESAKLIKNGKIKPVLNDTAKVDKQSDNNPIDRLHGKGWKPGQSGNPKGRPPKGLAISDILNTKSDAIGSDGQTRRSKMLEVVYNLAMKGERWAVEEFKKKIK